MGEKKEKGRCINPDRVPCDKARAYLKKKGLLCDEQQAHAPKKKISKSFLEAFLDEWFGS